MTTTHLDAAGVMAAECLCFRARRVSRAVTRLYDEALRPLGIQATQLTLMNAIALGAAQAGGGGVPMSRIADGMAMDVTTVSRTVRTLEKDGLVAIERSPEDRRVRVVSLTAAGERMLVEALPAWRRAQDRVVGALGRELATELKDGFDATAAAAAEGAEES